MNCEIDYDDKLIKLEDGETHLILSYRGSDISIKKATLNGCNVKNKEMILEYAEVPILLTNYLEPLGFENDEVQEGLFNTLITLSRTNLDTEQNHKTISDLKRIDATNFEYKGYPFKVCEQYTAFKFRELFDRFLLIEDYPEKTTSGEERIVTKIIDPVDKRICMTNAAEWDLFYSSFKLSFTKLGILEGRFSPCGNRIDELISRKGFANSRGDEYNWDVYRSNEKIFLENAVGECYELKR